MTPLATWVQRHFSLVLLSVLVSAVLWPGPWATAMPAVLPILGAMIFLGGLRVDTGVVRSRLGRPWRLAGDILGQMLLLPLAAGLLMQALAPEYTLGAMAVVATPAATSSPALTALLGGCVATAVILLVGTSLLAPLSLPTVLAFGGGQVELDTGAMMLRLVLVLALPLGAAILLRRRAPRLCTRLEPLIGGLVTVLLALVCAIPVATQGEALRSGGLALLTPFALSFALLAGQLGLGWLLGLGREPGERRALALSLCFKNIALTAALALTFFDEHGRLFCILTQISWVLLLCLFRGALQRSDRRREALADDASAEALACPR